MEKLIKNNQKKEVIMILVFIFLILLIATSILFLILITSTIKIKIENLKLGKTIKEKRKISNINTNILFKQNKNTFNKTIKK